jgi:hypothetical protein
MWAQRVHEAEAVLCRTSDPAAVRAAIAAHERCEADWQAARSERQRPRAGKCEALQEQQNQQALQQQQRWIAYTRAVEARRAVDEQEEADLVAYEAGCAEAARLTAKAQTAKARKSNPLTLRNGTWRGWGGLSASDRDSVAESSDWDMDIDDRDEWTRHVVDTHMVPASELGVTPGFWWTTR